MSSSIVGSGTGPGTIIRAYRFALDPSPAQERALRSHAGAARFGWNWALARCKERYAAERTWYSAAELHKLWNQVKKADPALAWWQQNSKCAYQEAFRDLDRALRNFMASKKGQHKGKRVGFPRFKKRGKCRDSCRFSDRPMRCSGVTLTLPRLGVIRTHESTRKLARRLDNGSARILSATVSRTAQRWYCSFTVQVDRAAPAEHTRPGTAIGVDLGVSTLLTGADNAGNIITADGPKALRASLRKLRRASRAHSRKVKGSANRRKEAAKLARIHARIANVRTDALHKATTALARDYEMIVCEDLHVAGMVRNRRLARAIADQGFGQARRMLAYKAAWNGGRLMIADRWYPSSKTCSGCGAVKAKLALSERTYRCERCGLTLDRDINAACNLAALAALISSTGTGVAGDLEPEGSNGRGADHKTGPGPAGGAEASTPRRAAGQDGDRPPVTASCE